MNNPYFYSLPVYIGITSYYICLGLIIGMIIEHVAQSAGDRVRIYLMVAYSLGAYTLYVASRTIETLIFSHNHSIPGGAFFPLYCHTIFVSGLGAPTFIREYIRSKK